MKLPRVLEDVSNDNKIKRGKEKEKKEGGTPGE